MSRLEPELIVYTVSLKKFLLCLYFIVKFLFCITLKTLIYSFIYRIQSLEQRMDPALTWNDENTGAVSSRSLSYRFNKQIECELERSITCVIWGE